MPQLFSRYLTGCVVVALFVSVGCDSTSVEPDPEPEPEPLVIELVSQLDPGGEEIRHSDVWGYVDPNTEKEYALLGSWGTDILYIIDVSDPATPTTVATVNVPSFDMKVWKNYAYTVTGGSDGGQNLGRIIDLSNPANPGVVGSFPSSHNVFIDTNGYMYLEAPGLRIFDLNQDPLNPKLLWSSEPSGGHDASVIGNYLYDFHGGDGTNIYNITSPGSPQLMSAITDPTIGYNHSGWTSKDEQFLFICDEFAKGETADISIWNISDKTNPSRVGGIVDTSAIVHNLYVVDDLAFVSYYTAGFRVYDVSDPTQPSLVFEHDTSASSGEGFDGAWGNYPFTPSRHVYVSDIENGLFVFSVTGEVTSGP